MPDMIDHLEECLAAAEEYISVLEFCQDGYYRANESPQALRWHELMEEKQKETLAGGNKFGA